MIVSYVRQQIEVRDLASLKVEKVGILCDDIYLTVK